MLLLFTYIAIAVGFSFLCSIAEAVILSTPKSHIVTLEKNQDPAGKILRELKENITDPLAVILTFNTIAHTLGAAGAGAQATALFGSVYFGAFSAVLTLLILVLSEIIPKALGSHYWRSLAPTTGYCLFYLIKVFYPFVVLSNKLTQFITPSEPGSHFNRDEIVALAALGAEEGLLEKQEALILQNLIYLREIKVKQVMTPRPVIFCVPEDMTISQYLSQHAEQAFSRIPLYNPDDVITGFALRSDILHCSSVKQTNKALSEIARPINAILDEQPLLTALEQCLSKHLHILLVVNEYGDTKGIITLEDIFERLLGIEIIDEGDRVENLQAYARRLGEIKRHRLLEKNQRH